MDENKIDKIQHEEFIGVLRNIWYFESHKFSNIKLSPLVREFVKKSKLV